MYYVLVDLASGTSKTLQVETDATLDNCDEDMLASNIERCLEEQHGLVIGENLLHWEIV